MLFRMTGLKSDISAVDKRKCCEKKKEQRAYRSGAAKVFNQHFISPPQLIALKCSARNDTSADGNSGKGQGGLSLSLLVRLLLWPLCSAVGIVTDSY